MKYLLDSIISSKKTSHLTDVEFLACLVFIITDEMNECISYIKTDKRIYSMKLIFDYYNSLLYSYEMFKNISNKNFDGFDLIIKDNDVIIPTYNDFTITYNSDDIFEIVLHKEIKSDMIIINGSKYGNYYIIKTEYVRKLCKSKYTIKENIKILSDYLVNDIRKNNIKKILE